MPLVTCYLILELRTCHWSDIYSKNGKTCHWWFQFYLSVTRFLSVRLFQHNVRHKSRGQRTGLILLKIVEKFVFILFLFTEINPISLFSWKIWWRTFLSWVKGSIKFTSGLNFRSILILIRFSVSCDELDLTCQNWIVYHQNSKKFLAIKMKSLKIKKMSEKWIQLWKFLLQLIEKSLDPCVHYFSLRFLGAMDFFLTLQASDFRF